MLSRNIFLLHVFVRDLTYSVGALGWVYLFVSGVPLTHLLTALLGFRIFETFICMPYAHRLALRFSPKALVGVSLILQAGFIISFPLVVGNYLFLFGTILLLSLFDVLYWPARDNFERALSGGSLSNRIGLSRAVTVAAESIGFALAGAGIAYSPGSIFLWAALGIIASALPFMLVKTPATLHKRPPHAFFQTIELHQGVRKFISNPVVLLIAFAAMTKEIADLLLPLALAFTSVEVIEIGYLLSIFVLCHFGADLVSGFISARHRRRLFTYCGTATLALFLIFILLPRSNLSIFFILLAALSGPWFTIINVYVQSFVRSKLPNNSGGYFIEFVDDGARIILYPFFLLLPLLSAPLFISSMLVLGSVSVAGALLVGARKVRDA